MAISELLVIIISLCAGAADIQGARESPKVATESMSLQGQNRSRGPGTQYSCFLIVLLLFHDIGNSGN